MSLWQDERDGEADVESEVAEALQVSQGPRGTGAPVVLEGRRGRAACRGRAARAGRREAEGKRGSVPPMTPSCSADHRLPAV